MNLKSLNLKPFVIFGLFFLTACQTAKKTQLYQKLQKNNCGAYEKYAYAAEALPQPLHETPLDSLLVKHFTPRSLQMAHSFGFLDLVLEYVQAGSLQKQEPSLENQFQKLELLQKLNQKINSASLEVSTLLTKLNCEEERLEQIVSYLTAQESAIQSKLTVTAIVLGGVAAITGGVNSQRRSARVIGLSAGVVEASLGAFMWLKKVKIPLAEQDENALQEVWEGKTTSSLFSPAIWYYLNYEQGEELSARAKLVQSWLDFGLLSPSKGQKKLGLIDASYFTQAGSYGLDELKNRAEMYDQLEALIMTMTQDLKALALELENLAF